MSGEGDLDSIKGHSQPSVGTLPLTDKNSFDSVSTEKFSPQEKQPSQRHSETTSIDPLLKQNPSNLGVDFEKGVQNLLKARQETVTIPHSEQLEQIKTTPPSKDKTHSGSPDNPFSRF